LLVDENAEGRTDIRMTLDTKEDFENLKQLYSEINTPSQKNPSIKDIVTFLDKNQHFLERMVKEINNNSK